MLLVLSAVLVSVLAVQYTAKVLNDGSAFVRWRSPIQGLVQGQNVYHTDAYPNPPLLAICLYPLTLLPPVAGALVWFFLKVGMGAIALYWSTRLGAGRDHSLPIGGVALVVLLALRPFTEDLLHGNVNILIFALVTAGLWAFVHGRDTWAGLAIALGATFKVTPVLFIPYFAYKRQWRVVAGCAIGLALFLIVLPAVVLGPVRNVELLAAWADLMIKPYVFHGAIAYTIQINQSLPGLFFRLFTDSPGVMLSDETTVHVNWVALDPSIARWILRGLLAAIAGWLVWLCRTPARNRTDWRLACEFGLVVIAMLFISQRSWKSHYVTMALPFSAVVGHWLLRARGGAMGWFLASTLFVAFVSMASTIPYLTGWIVNGAGHKYAEAYGMFFLGGLAIFVALSVILIRSRQLPIMRIADG
jgi:hypothetical protein